MKVKLKTKEQLLKMGWKENLRSIYFRLSIDGIKSKAEWGSKRNKLGALTCSQVDNCLGQSGTVKKFHLSADGSQQFLLLEIIDCGSSYWVAVPENCVVGFNQKKWDMQNEIWEFKINNWTWRYSPFRKSFTNVHLDIKSMKKAISFVENKIKKSKKTNK